MGSTDRPYLSSAARGGTDVWLTPPWILDAIRQDYTIALDPCTEPDNPCDAELWLSEGMAVDGLAYRWAACLDGWDRGVCYVNPPYGQLTRSWGAKIDHEASQGCPIIALLPSRTDRGWFRRLARSSDRTEGHLLFLSSRVKFHGRDGLPHRYAAPFPSVMMSFNCEIPSPLWEKGWMPCCQ